MCAAPTPTQPCIPATGDLSWRLLHLPGPRQGAEGSCRDWLTGLSERPGCTCYQDPGLPPSRHRDPPESWPAAGVALGGGLRVCPPPTGSLIQVPMSEKGKITRGRLGSLSLKKEGERQCFLFSKHLIICTRGSGGKLHLTKVRAAGAAEARGGHHHGGPADPDLGPRRRARDQTRECTRVCWSDGRVGESWTQPGFLPEKSRGTRERVSGPPEEPPTAGARAEGPGGLDKPPRGARVRGQVEDGTC